MKRLSPFEQVLALIAVIFFLLAAFQVYRYQAAAADVEEAEEIVGNARRKLSVLLDDDPKVLKAELNKLEKELGEGKSVFPKTVAPLDVAALILGAVKTRGLALSTLTVEATKEGPKEKESLTTTTNFTAKAKAANLLSIYSFFADLEKGPFPTLVLQKVSLENQGEGWDAAFQVAVVTQAE